MAELPPIPPRPRRDGLPPIAVRPRESGDGLPPLGPRPVRGSAPLGAATGPPDPPRPRRRRRIGGAQGPTAWLIAAVALFAGLFGGLIGASLQGDEPAPAATPTTQPIPVSSTPETSLAELVSRTAPSVVQVITSGGEGSGVILSPSGLIVTNAHVMGTDTRATIVTADERRVQASLVRSSEREDLAILQPRGQVGRGAILAEEPDSGLRPGDAVFAIGSPFSLRNTVTAGVVSALGRDTGNGVPMIQIDAPINPGNSGGGLFDMRGRLVGVPTSIYAPIRGNVGIGFAVPAARVRALVDSAP